MQLVNLCLGTCYFQFNNRVYQQVNSLAMGNPLSAFAANCFMSSFETKANYPDFPALWYRYADDTCVVIHKDKVNDFMNYLNSINSRIKFTCEIECGGVLPFLDLQLKRINSKFEFNIFRKETATDRCIPSTSYHSQQTKLASFNSYCYRTVNLPLSDDDMNAEMDKIYRIADVNGFNHRNECDAATAAPYTVSFDVQTSNSTQPRSNHNEPAESNQAHDENGAD